MKKARIDTFLRKLEQKLLANHIGEPEVHICGVQAIAHCRTWATLTWARMLEPVDNERAVLLEERTPLAEKDRSGLCSEGEKSRLRQLALHESIYAAFGRKIAPTVFRAQQVQKVRRQRRRLIPTELPPPLH